MAAVAIGVVAMAAILAHFHRALQRNQDRTRIKLD